MMGASTEISQTSVTSLAPNFNLFFLYQKKTHNGTAFSHAWLKMYPQGPSQLLCSRIAAFDIHLFIALKYCFVYFIQFCSCIWLRAKTMPPVSIIIGTAGLYWCFVTKATLCLCCKWNATVFRSELKLFSVARRSVPELVPYSLSLTVLLTLL